MNWTRSWWGALALTGVVSSAAVSQTTPLMAVHATPAAAEESVLERPAKLQVRQVTLEQALVRLVERSGVPVSFSPSLLPRDVSVSCECRSLTIRETLDRLLAGTSMRYREISNHVLIVDQPLEPEIVHQLPPVRYARLSAGEDTPARTARAEVRAQARAGTITGRVVDAATQQPLSGASVVVVGTGRGVLSNASGNFLIPGVPAGAQRLRVTLIGYGASEQSVTVVDGQAAAVTFAMEAEAVQLEGIVAVGYGTQRKRDVTGAVASIRMDELENVQVPSVAQALQGRVAGVHVTQNSSAPGSGVSIRIRGSGSISSTNEPLYVVDGVPISGGDSNDPTGGRGRSNSLNPLAFLNPEDIESVEVLKDASSAAIYGARGTNGVVLITTRKGRAGESRIEVESSYGMQSVTRTLPMLNGTQFAEYANEWARIKGLNAPYANPSSFGAGTDWQSLIFRDAPVQEHNLSIRGGTESTRFAVAGNFSSQEGVVIGSAFSRYSGRASVEHDARDWLTVGANMNASRINGSLGFSDAATAGNMGGAVSLALAMVPTMGVRNEQGQYSWNDRDWPQELASLGLAGATVENPVGLVESTTDAIEYDRLLGNAFANIDLLPGLSLRLSSGVDLVNNSRDEYYSSESRRGGTGINGLADMGILEQSRYLAESILNYVPDLGDVHRLNLTGGVTYEREEQLSRRLENSNFPNDITKFYNVGAGSPVGGPGVDSGWQDWTLLSVLGRANYSLADRYLLTLTGRADGSSKFGAENRWGFFPSGSVAWRVSEEPFLRSADWLSDLKLRVSYGVTGNQEIGTYASLTRLSDVQYTFNGPIVSGYRPSSIGNPALRWEQSRQFDAGFDAALLDHRLSLTFDVYEKTTADLLLSVPLPYETGFGSALQNLGSVRNRGVELSIQGDLVRGTPGAFSWRTGVNFGANRNTVVEIGETDEMFGGTVHSGSRFGGLLVREGDPMGVFFGYETDGIFRSQAEADAYVNGEGKPIMPGAVVGQARFLDQNGDGRINAADRVILGNPEPDFTLGWSNDLRFGGFTLYTMFQGTFGNEVWNTNLSEIGVVSMRQNLYAPRFLDAWSPENPNGSWPVLTVRDGTGYIGAGTQAGDLIDHFVEDGSYLRLRTLTLGYDLPARLAERWGGMQSARIFTSADNLFTWTSYRGYNPDVNTTGQHNINRGVDLGGYPLARVFRVGLRLGL